MNYSWIYNTDVIFIAELTQNQDNSKTEIILDKIHKLILEALDRHSDAYPPEKRTGQKRKVLEELEQLWDNKLFSLHNNYDINSLKLLTNSLVRIKQKYVGGEYIVSIKSCNLMGTPYKPYEHEYNKRAVELSLEQIIYNGLDYFNGKHYEERVKINEIVKLLIINNDLDENTNVRFNFHFHLHGLDMDSFIEEIFYYKWLKKQIEIYETYREPISETYIETQILNQFKTAKSKLDTYLSDPRNVKPNKRHWALFHYYLQKAGIEPEFPTDGKKEAIALLCQNNIHFGDKTNFEKYYNEFHQNSSRLNQSELHNLELVAILISDFPDAQNLVNDDITKAKKLGKK